MANIILSIDDEVEKESILIMLDSEDVLKKKLDNRANERWNRVN